MMGICETGNSSIGGIDIGRETGARLDGKRSSKKSGDRSETGEKFLVAVIESRLEAEQPESVLGSMPELAEIVLESFLRC